MGCKNTLTIFNSKEQEIILFQDVIHDKMVVF